MGPGQSTDVRADRSDGQGPGHSAGPAPRGCLAQWTPSGPRGTLCRGLAVAP